MRHNDWSIRLNHMVNNNKERPFKWGSWDCCLFAAEAVKAMTGEDLASDLRGRYRTELGALRAIKKVGCNSIEELLDSRLNTETPRLLACRGDVALVDRPGGDAAGIIYGAGILVVTREGMQQIPLSLAKKVWSVN